MVVNLRSERTNSVVDYTSQYTSGWYETIGLVRQTVVDGEKESKSAVV